MKRFLAALVLTLSACALSAQEVTFMFDSVIARGKIGGVPATPAAGQMVWVLDSLGHFTKTNVGSVGKCWMVLTSTTLGWNTCGGGGGGFSNTTKGDLHGFDTADARVPVGANGTFLTGDSTAGVGVSWRTLLAADIPAIPESGVTSLVTDLAAKLNLSGGTMSGAIAMGAHKVTGVTDPTAGSQDAATAHYVDAGDTAEASARTTADALKLNLSGGTMSGVIAMGAHKITGMADPSHGTQDAATAVWVESRTPHDFGINGLVTTAAFSNGANNDVSMTGVDSLVGGTPSAAFSITGLGALGYDGQSFKLIYSGTQAFTIANQNTGSIAADRIIAPGGADLVLACPCSATFEYDGAVSRYRVVAYATTIPTGTVYTASSGVGLTGTNFALDISSLTAKTTPTTADQIPIYDVGGSTNKKVTIGDLATAVGLTGVTLQATTPGTADTGNTHVTGTGIFDTALSINTNAPRTGGFGLDFTYAGSGGRGATFGQYTNDTGANYLWFQKSRGTKASPTAILSGDTIGQILAAGYDGTVYRSPAAIKIFADAAPVNNTSLASAIAFYSGIVGAAGGTERLRINSSGDTLFMPATSGSGSGLKAQATGSGGVVWALPNADGSANQVLATNGSGVLSWQTATGVGGSGNVTSSTALGSEPGGAATGDINLPTNGFGIQRYANGTWANTWGPLYPLTFPPLLVSTQATTLSGNGGSITAIATTMLVASSAGFPATPFLARIGTEDIKVTTVSSLTWTIVRGYNATTGATHADGVAVTQVNWEWVNQGATATATQHNQGIYLDGGTSSAANNVRILKRLIGSNTTLTAAYIPLLNTVNASSTVGLVLRESATGKLVTIVTNMNGVNLSLAIDNWASPTTFSSQPQGATWANQAIIFSRVVLSGLNVEFWRSGDGQHWQRYDVFTKIAQLGFTSGPDEWGLESDPNSVTANIAAENVISFAETP